MKPTAQMDNNKVYYGIGEVAETLGVNVSCVRYWANEFADIIKPHRNKKRNRFFTRRDLTNLRKIHYLVKECGFSLQGARAKLEAEKFVPRRPAPVGRPPKTEDAATGDAESLLAHDDIAIKAEALARLANVRAMLVEINKYL